MTDKETNSQCQGGRCGSCSQRSTCHCPQAALVGRGNLESYDWLKGVNGGEANQLVEVMFKNTRKSYYLNSSNLQLKVGDAVVVEGSPGQDLGKVTMTGPLVALQMRRASLRSDFEPKRLYRLATESDIERFLQARDREHDTMIQSRKIAADLGLKMKIGDVEYQGDGHKAIFYYIADERVDFRKLIRILAETFGIRVEMKQIGARQEAGRIGGIGPCGRPLCCATYLTRFASVGTGAARLQDISMNPQKLAGQCAKLKCCLNFEVDTYVESVKKLPPKDVVLHTKEQEYYYFKADILKREISYSTVKNQPVNLITVPASRAFEIIALNNNGVKPDLLVNTEDKPRQETEFVELVGQDSLTRFDKNRNGKKRRGKGNVGNGNGESGKKIQRSQNVKNREKKANSGNTQVTKTKPKSQSANVYSKKPGQQRSRNGGKESSQQLSNDSVKQHKNKNASQPVSQSVMRMVSRAPKSAKKE